MYHKLFDCKEALFPPEMTSQVFKVMRSLGFPNNACQIILNFCSYYHLILHVNAPYGQFENNDPWTPHETKWAPVTPELIEPLKHVRFVNHVQMHRDMLPNDKKDVTPDHFKHLLFIDFSEKDCLYDLYKTHESANWTLAMESFWLVFYVNFLQMVVLI